MTPAEIALREMAAGNAPVITEEIVNDIRDALVTSNTFTTADAVELLMLGVGQLQEEVRRLKELAESGGTR